MAGFSRHATGYRLIRSQTQYPDLQGKCFIIEHKCLLVRHGFTGILEIETFCFVSSSPEMVKEETNGFPLFQFARYKLPLYICGLQ